MDKETNCMNMNGSIHLKGRYRTNYVQKMPESAKIFGNKITVGLKHIGCGNFQSKVLQYERGMNSFLLNV